MKKDRNQAFSKQKSKTYDSNVIVGIIPACGQNNDMFYSHHNSLLPVGNNITAIEHSIYECISLGCASIWINCHPSITNILKLTFGNYFKNPNFVRIKKFTDCPPVPKYIPIYYMNPSWSDFNKRTSWIYTALYASKTASSIVRKIMETTIDIKCYFSFPTGIMHFDNRRLTASILKKSKNFCFENEGKTFKDNCYMGFSLDRKQIDEALEKLTFLETEYTDYGFNSRFFPISKVMSHLNIDKFTRVQVKAYYPIYTNQKYFDYLKKGDYSTLKKRSKYVKNYINARLPKYEKESND